MRLIYLLVLMVLVTSCNNTIKIKSTDFVKSSIKDALIRTTGVDTEVEKGINMTVPKPKIDIISPKDGEVINGSTIIVRLNISNFRLVTPDRYPKQGQGHVQIWVDDMEFRGSRTEFIFENESNGTHVIKAELMMSNNTVLPYSKAIKVNVTKT